MRFILRRLGFFVVTLWAAITLNFLIPRLMPGNAALAMMARYRGHINPQALHALEIAFGVNDAPEPLSASTSATSATSSGAASGSRSPSSRIP